MVYGCTYMVGEHHCTNDCYDRYGNYVVNDPDGGRVRVCDQMAEMKDISEHLESAHGFKVDNKVEEATKRVAETCKEMSDEKKEKIKNDSGDEEAEISKVTECTKPFTRTKARRLKKLGYCHVSKDMVPSQFKEDIGERLNENGENGCQHDGDVQGRGHRYNY